MHWNVVSKNIRRATDSTVATGKRIASSLYIPIVYENIRRSGIIKCLMERNLGSCVTNV
jgi:hypothetical protein